MSGSRGRAGWGLADQVVSSLTNALLSVLVARSVDAPEFGAFGIAFALYSFAVGTSRAMCSQPLAIKFSGRSAHGVREAGRASTGTALVVGVVTGAALALAGVLVPGVTGAALLVVGVTMPGLLLQDAWRYVFFTAGRPRAALANDLIWGVLQVGAVLVLIGVGATHVGWLLGAWGASATVAALAGVAQARAWPTPASTRSWLHEHRRTVPYLAGEYAVNMGAFNAALLVVGALGQLATVGAVRGAQVLLGPLRVLVLAAQSSGLPEVARRARERPGRLRRDCLAISTALAATTAGVTVVLVLMPDEVGEALLGDTWSSADLVLPWVGLMLVATSLTSGATIGLHALDLGRWTLRASLWQAPATLVLGAGAAMVGGPALVAAGFAASHAVGAVYLWRRLVLSTSRA